MHCILLRLQNYNRPSPFGTFLRKFRNLRTVIVTADIHQGLYSQAQSCDITSHI